MAAEDDSAGKKRAAGQAIRLVNIFQVRRTEVRKEDANELLIC